MGGRDRHSHHVHRHHQHEEDDRRPRYIVVEESVNGDLPPPPPPPRSSKKGKQVSSSYASPPKSSSVRTSPTAGTSTRSPHSRTTAASSSLSPEERQRLIHAEKRRIVPKLAHRSYHLHPENSWCQDWVGYMCNNHPVFGMCCHHRYHPVRLPHRLLCLLGSIAIGVIVTNMTQLYYRYSDVPSQPLFSIQINRHEPADDSNRRGRLLEDEDEFLVVTEGDPMLLENEDSSALKQDVDDDDATAEVVTKVVFTHGMLVLWTLGGAVHSIMDFVLWHATACACCRAGGILGQYDGCCCSRLGTVVTTTVVAILVAIATVLVVQHASEISQHGVDEERREWWYTYTSEIPKTNNDKNDDIFADEGNDDDDFERASWGNVDSVRNFAFLAGYGVELLLALFVYYPLIVTVLFSGVLGCGRLPGLGGRPREVYLEKLQKEKKKRKQELAGQKRRNTAQTARSSLQRGHTFDSYGEEYYDDAYRHPHDHA